MDKDYNALTVAPFVDAAAKENGAEADAHAGWNPAQAPLAVAPLNRAMDLVRLAQQQRANDPHADLEPVLGAAIDREVTTLEIAIAAIRALQADARSSIAAPAPGGPPPGPSPAPGQPSTARSVGRSADTWQPAAPAADD